MAARGAPSVTGAGGPTTGGPPAPVAAGGPGCRCAPHAGQNFASTGIGVRQREHGRATTDDGSIDRVARVVDIGQHAFGVIAIGQVATGVIAIGQVATGVIAIGQVARGVVAIGMGALGVITIGMGALGISWSAGMVAVGGRTGKSLVGIPLLPRLPRPPTVRWGVLGSVQLAMLVAACVAFWILVAVPLGDALFGPDGLVRDLAALGS